MHADTPHLRLGIVGVVVVALMGTLAARLWYLQVLDAPDYAAAAEIVQVRDVPLEGTRGRILDRRGRVIVDNRISTVITIDPAFLRDDEHRLETLTAIAEELTRAGRRTKVATLERRLDDPRYNPIEPRPLAIDVPEEVVVLLGERVDELPGITVRRRAVRTYPYGELAAHVLGYTGRISPDELIDKADEPATALKPYAAADEIGKAGVERIFEMDLRGTPGQRRVEVDANEVPLRTLDEVLPVPGSDVQLTIDIDIQAAAEEALADQIRATRAPAGSIVVLDPQTGAVLALASHPTYDPGEFVNGISNERYAELQAEGADPFLSRAVQSGYAPGSTFKLATAYAALDAGMIVRETSQNDIGYYTLRNCTGRKCEFQNAERKANGSVNLPRSLTVSSDYYFYWLGERFWLEREQYGHGIQAAARTFGLGQASGIQLPSEASGHIPDPETKAARHEDNPEAFPFGDWFTGDNVNMSIGQGDVLVTPLQLANLYASFGNGGTVHAPNIVMRVLDTTGDGPARVVRAITPRVQREVEMAPGVRDPIVEGLVGVTSAIQGGTGARAFAGFDTVAFPIAAKTGTAQVNNKEDTSVFAAYGPVDRPEYAVAVVIEEGGFGSRAAAPAARAVFDRLSGQVRLEPAPTDRPVIVLQVPEDVPLLDDEGGR